MFEKIMKTIDGILGFFKPAKGAAENPISRMDTYEEFALNVTGTLLREDDLGVTSAVRSLKLSGDTYENLLHMYHSDAIDIEAVNRRWIEAVDAQGVAYHLQSEKDLPEDEKRAVLVGDHKKTAKEARHQAGVERLHQESETQTKGETIWGHCCGCVSMLAGNDEKGCVCIPLIMDIEHGLNALAGWIGSRINPESMIQRMYRNTTRAADALGKSVLFLCDTAFLSKDGLRMLDEYNKTHEGKEIQVLTRCKGMIAAYEPPKEEEGTRRGRKRKKGDRVSLWEAFSSMKESFKARTIMLYGRKQEVKALAVNLLWGKGYYKRMRFILVVLESGARSILATTDLSMDPFEAVALYGRRFRIENAFRELSQVYSAFKYRFWTKACPRTNHFSSSNEPDPLESIVDEGQRKKILDNVNAIELYMLVCCIAMGINQIIGLTLDLDRDSFRWQRTPAKEIPSEANVAYVLREAFKSSVKYGFFDCESLTLQIIRKAQGFKKKKRSWKKETAA